MDAMDRKINDLKILSVTALQELCEDIRIFDRIKFLTGGHIGANLGVVELSIALHEYWIAPQMVLFLILDI